MGKKKSNPRSNGKDGRNTKGQFKKGNTLSRGNSGGGNREKAKKLKRILIDAVSEKDIKTIVKKMVMQAKNGDEHARKELFDRIWGRAKQEIDVGTEDETVTNLIEWLLGRNGSEN